MSEGSVNVVESARSLADLIRVVHKRVNRATDLIGSSDDQDGLRSSEQQSQAFVAQVSLMLP